VEQLACRRQTSQLPSLNMLDTSKHTSKHMSKCTGVRLAQLCDSVLIQWQILVQPCCAHQCKLPNSALNQSMPT
jgi:hypothetical protein